MAIDRSGIRFTPDRFTPASSPFQQTGTLSGSRAVVDPVSFFSGAPTVPGATAPGTPKGPADQFQVLKDLEFTEDGLTRDYYEAANELVQMQESAARDGWDVSRPDPSNPEQYRASQYYRKLKSWAENTGNALQQTRTYADNYAKGVAAGTLRPDQRAGTRMTTLRNLGQMTAQSDLHPIVAEHNNAYATIYAREGVAKADQFKRTVISQLESDRMRAAQSGNVREVERLDDSIAALENHYYDPSKDLDRAQRERASKRKAKGDKVEPEAAIKEFVNFINLPVGEQKKNANGTIIWERTPSGYKVRKSSIKNGKRVWSEDEVTIGFGDEAWRSGDVLDMIQNLQNLQGKKIYQVETLGDKVNDPDLLYLVGGREEDKEYREQLIDSQVDKAIKDIDIAFNDRSIDLDQFLEESGLSGTINYTDALRTDYTVDEDALRAAITRKVGEDIGGRMANRRTVIGTPEYWDEEMTWSDMRSGQDTSGSVLGPLSIDPTADQPQAFSPGQVFTIKGEDYTYEELISAGWNDDQLKELNNG